MARVAKPGWFLTVLVSLLAVDPIQAIRSNPKFKKIRTVSGVSGIKPTSAGYITVDKDSSSIYYAYYESQARSEDIGEAPIILWLQGGPGCASTFGGFYELGPWSITADLGVGRNPGTWNRIFGLLLMDQPMGTGYSRAANGSSSIPRDEMGMATHLYAALQGFFSQHLALASRPLFIAGESYAGKYVPSIAHYILQAQRQEPRDAAAAAAAGDGENDAAETFLAGSSRARRSAAQVGATAEAEALAFASGSADLGEAAEAAEAPPLRFHRALPAGIQPPLFRLAGVAIGNGLTDPRAQTQTLAATAYYSGLLPPALRDDVAAKAAEVVGLIDESKWQEAHEARERLRRFIANATGLATMFDTRRTENYDPTKAVDRFLDLPEVKEAMRADPNVHYVSCSEVVGEAMSADVMRSVKHLIPDLLAHIPVLLYQGQYDILDGVASVTSWLGSLEWPDRADFNAVRGKLWFLGGDNQSGSGGGAAAAAAAATGAVDEANGGGDGKADQEKLVAGWWRSAGRLTQVVVYRAGHMVPHDQPLAAQQMMEEWVLGALEGSRAPRQVELGP